MTDAEIEAKLAELGLTLPQAAAPVAAYVPVVITGGLAHVSGQLPFIGSDFVKGRLGETLAERRRYPCDFERDWRAVEQSYTVNLHDLGAFGEIQPLRDMAVSFDGPETAQLVEDFVAHRRHGLGKPLQ